MAEEDYLPDAPTIARIEQDIARYNERRQEAQAEIGRRMPMAMMLFVIGAVAVHALVYLVFWPSDFALRAMIFLFVGSLVGLGVVRHFVHGIGADTQQEFRNHMLPVLFGFVDSVRYRSSFEPGSFSRLPSQIKGPHNARRFDDFVSGRVNGKHFELYELALLTRSKSSEKIRFRGLVLTCHTDEPVEGLLVATVIERNPFRAIKEFLTGEKMSEVTSGTALDRLYEFRTDNPAAAKAVLGGGLAEVLEWLVKRWPRSAVRIAQRRSELFVMLPTDKNFFELPALDRRLDYRRDLEPMMKDFASLMVIVDTVQRMGREATPPPEAVEAPPLVEHEAEPARIPLLDPVDPPVRPDRPAAGSG
jgi:hypothetical protein